jgi:hypothetical protein
MTINLTPPSSWRSSLVGLLSAGLAVWDIWSSVSAGVPFAMAIKSPLVIQAFLVGLLGWLTKDKQVTGGTDPATPEAARRVADDTGSKLIRNS